MKIKFLVDVNNRGKVESIWTEDFIDHRIPNVETVKSYVVSFEIDDPLKPISVISDVKTANTKRRKTNENQHHRKRKTSH